MIGWLRDRLRAWLLQSQALSDPPTAPTSSRKAAGLGPCDLCSSAAVDISVDTVRYPGPEGFWCHLRLGLPRRRCAEHALPQVEHEVTTREEAEIMVEVEREKLG